LVGHVAEHEQDVGERRVEALPSQCWTVELSFLRGWPVAGDFDIGAEFSDEDGGGFGAAVVFDESPEGNDVASVGAEDVGEDGVGDGGVGLAVGEGDFWFPADMVVARLQASARQNDLTKAIQEYGRVVKTISLVRYLHDEKHRRRILAQLNKGESLHALRREIFFANLGQFMRRRPDEQDLQAQCLTLAPTPSSAGTASTSKPPSRI
jgi:hypothetical protein